MASGDTLAIFFGHPAGLRAHLSTNYATIGY
jgi:hypothetical protein